MCVRPSSEVLPQQTISMDPRPLKKQQDSQTQHESCVDDSSRIDPRSGSSQSLFEFFASTGTAQQSSPVRAAGVPQECVWAAPEEPSLSCEEVLGATAAVGAAPHSHHTCPERERFWATQNHRLKSTLVKILERYDELLTQNGKTRRLLVRLIELRKQRQAQLPKQQQQQQAQLPKQQQQQAQLPKQRQQQQAQLPKQQQQPPVAACNVNNDERREMYGKYELLVKRNVQLERALKQAHRQATLLPAAPSDQSKSDELKEYRAMVKIQMASAVEDYKAEQAQKEHLEELNAQLHQQVEQLTDQLHQLRGQMAVRHPPEPAAPAGYGWSEVAHAANWAPAAAGSQATAGNRGFRGRIPLPPPGHSPLRYSESLPSPHARPGPTSGVSRSVDEVLNAPYEAVQVFPPPPPPLYDVQIDRQPADRHKMVLVTRTPQEMGLPALEVSQSAGGSGRDQAGESTARARNQVVRSQRARSKNEGRRDAANRLLDDPPPANLPQGLLDELVRKSASGAVYDDGDQQASDVERSRGPSHGDQMCDTAERQGVVAARQRPLAIRDSGYSESQMRCDIFEDARVREGYLTSPGELTNSRGYGIGSHESGNPVLSGSKGDQTGAEANRTAGGGKNEGMYRSASIDRKDDFVRALSNGVRIYPSNSDSINRFKETAGRSDSKSAIGDSASPCDPYADISCGWTIVGDSWLPTTVTGLSLHTDALSGACDLPGSKSASSYTPREAPHRAQVKTRGLQKHPTQSNSSDFRDLVDGYVATQTRTEVTCPHCGRVFAHAQNMLYLDHIERCPGRRVLPS